MALIAPVAVGANGTLAGTAPKAPAGKFFEPTARAYQLTPTLVARRVPVNATTGRFSAKVPPGLYGVIVNGWVTGKPKTLTRLVQVRGGKTVRFPRLTAGVAPPPPLRVSIGQIQATAPGYAYLQNGLADMMYSDFPYAAMGKCAKSRMGLYEDRKYGRFKDVLREVQLGKSRFADPAFRAAALRAEVTLKAYTPTHRVMGTVDTISDGHAAGTFRLVELATGKVSWEQRVESVGPGAWAELPAEAARALLKHLCDPLPPKLRIEVSANFAASDDQASATLAATIGYDVVARVGEPGNYDLLSDANWTLGAFTLIDNGGPCVVTPGGPVQARGQPAGNGAVLRDGVARVDLFPLLTVTYVESEPMPPIGCNGLAGVQVSQGAVPAIVVKAPLGVPTPVSGSALQGSYTATVTVTPLTS